MWTKQKRCFGTVVSRDQLSPPTPMGNGLDFLLILTFGDGSFRYMDIAVDIFIYNLTN